jgi:cytoskeletal protein RodZ
MSKTQSWLIMGVSSIALVIGALLATGALTSAQTNTPTTAPSATTAPTSAPSATPAPTSAPSATPAPTTAPSATPAPSGTFKSNEDPTHEKAEAPQREAQEDSGTAHPGGCAHGSGQTPTATTVPGA